MKDFHYWFFVFLFCAMTLLTGLTQLENAKLKASTITDKCQEIHGLETVSSEDFKPQYNRNRVKKVISTCGAIKEKLDND